MALDSHPSQGCAVVVSDQFFPDCYGAMVMPREKAIEAFTGRFPPEILDAVRGTAAGHVAVFYVVGGREGVIDYEPTRDVS